MSGPTTPGQEGPSYGPPSLPQGWTAQWDAVSKKYYFVQLSTGHSQWETPTHAAPTVGTPTQTPGQETSPFPQPGHPQEMGERGIGDQNGSDGERGIASMAMNTLLHSQGGIQSGKQSNPIVGFTGQLMGGGGKHNQSQQSSSAGIVGELLTGSLLSGGKTKPNQGPQQGYPGQMSQGVYGNQDGLMGKLGGILEGTNSSHQSNFGYSESEQHQSGYTGQAPSSSYQPAINQSSQGLGTYYSPQQSSYLQHQQDSSHSVTSSYYNPQQQPYPPNPQGGPNSGPSVYYNQQQLMHSMPQHHQQQQQQPGYAPQQQQQQPSYGMASRQEPYPSPIYIGPAPSNMAQPQHPMFQGLHNISYQAGLYGDGSSHGGPPQLPIGSHPNHRQQSGYPRPQGPGGYHETPESRRW